VLEVRPRALGEGVIGLGGGRTMMHQPIHPGVGFELDVAPGDTVQAGERTVVVHARDEAGARAGEAVARAAVRLGEPGQQAPERLPLVGERIAG